MSKKQTRFIKKLTYKERVDIFKNPEKYLGEGVDSVDYSIWDGKFEDYKLNEEDYIDYLPKEETVFNVGGCDYVPAETLKCKKCGSKSFNVGRGKLFTAIKCTNCGWEACIHDG